MNKKMTVLVTSLNPSDAITEIIINRIGIYTINYMHCKINPRAQVFPNNHGGNSKGTTCVVDRDVTAYLVVDRVLRFPTEQYGCRYGGYPGFNDVKVIF